MAGKDGKVTPGAGGTVETAPVPVPKASLWGTGAQGGQQGSAPAAAEGKAEGKAKGKPGGKGKGPAPSIAASLPPIPDGGHYAVPGKGDKGAVATIVCDKCHGLMHVSQAIPGASFYCAKCGALLIGPFAASGLSWPDAPVSESGPVMANLPLLWVPTGKVTIPIGQDLAVRLLKPITGQGGHQTILHALQAGVTGLGMGPDGLTPLYTLTVEPAVIQKMAGYAVAYGGGGYQGVYRWILCLLLARAFDGAEGGK